MRVLERAIELARPGNAKIVLLHVLRDADYPTRIVLSNKLWEEVRSRCEGRLEKLQSEKIGDSVRSRVLLSEGVPATAIADAAAEHSIDLIVLGCHGVPGRRKFLLGTTTERVARIAPCSVYVEKEKGLASK